MTSVYGEVTVLMKELLLIKDLLQNKVLQAQQGEDNFTTKSYLLGFYAPQPGKQGKEEYFKNCSGDTTYNR